MKPESGGESDATGLESPRLERAANALPDELEKRTEEPTPVIVRMSEADSILRERASSVRL